MTNLCLAGGVALNCVANGKILRDGRVQKHLDPACGRRRWRRARRGAGRLSVIMASRGVMHNKPDGMSGAYLGPAFDAMRSATLLDKPARSIASSTMEHCLMRSCRH